MSFALDGFASIPGKNKAMMKAKMLRRMTSDDSDTNETNGNKENIDTNKAAVVIQSRKFLDFHSCKEQGR